MKSMIDSDMSETTFFAINETVHIGRDPSFAQFTGGHAESDFTNDFLTGRKPCVREQGPTGVTDPSFES